MLRSTIGVTIYFTDLLQSVFKLKDFGLTIFTYQPQVAR